MSDIRVGSWVRFINDYYSTIRKVGKVIKISKNFFDDKNYLIKWFNIENKIVDTSYWYEESITLTKNPDSKLICKNKPKINNGFFLKEKISLINEDGFIIQETCGVVVSNPSPNNWGIKWKQHPNKKLINKISVHHSKFISKY